MQARIRSALFRATFQACDDRCGACVACGTASLGKGMVCLLLRTWRACSRREASECSGEFHASAPYRGSVRVAFFGAIVERRVFSSLVVVLQAWVLLLPGFWRLSEVVWYGMVYPGHWDSARLGGELPFPVTAWCDGLSWIAVQGSLRMGHGILPAPGIRGARLGRQ